MKKSDPKNLTQDSLATKYKNNSNEQTKIIRPRLKLAEE